MVFTGKYFCHTLWRASNNQKGRQDVSKKKMTVREVVDLLGSATVQASVSVSRQQVSNAVREDVMPARWFDAIEHLCRIEGIPCPRSLFNFAPIPGTTDQAPIARPE